MHVYIEKIDQKFNNEYLPDYITQELKSVKSEKVKLQKKAGYSLLYKIANEKLNLKLSPQDILKQKNAKPKCRFFDFSISHSNDLVVVAVSKNAVGVDIEYEKADRNLDLIKEKCFLPQEKNQDFYEIWTKKEAVFKTLNKTVCNLKEIDTFLYSCLTYKIFNENKKYSLSLYAKNLNELIEINVNPKLSYLLKTT